MKNTKNMLVKLGVTLGVFALMFSFASSASAALTLGALTITSDGALTMATTGAFTVPTITLASGETISNATAGGVIIATDDGLMVGGNANASNPLLKLSADTNDLTNGVRQGGLAIAINRPATDIMTASDGNPDTGLKVSVTNRSASEDYARARAIDATAEVRDSGAGSYYVEGMQMTAKSRSGTTVTDMTGARFVTDNGATASGNVVGVQIQDVSQSATGVNYGLLVNTSSYNIVREFGIYLDSNAGSWTNGITFEGTVTNVLDFVDADGTNGADTDAGVNQYAVTAPETADGLIQVDIGGTAYYIPVYDAGSVTNE